MLFAGNVNVEVKESSAVHAILVATAPISTEIICRSFMFLFLDSVVLISLFVFASSILSIRS